MGNYHSPMDAFEACVVKNIIHTTLTYGNYSGAVNGWYSDMGMVSLDGAAAEDIVHALFTGTSIASEESIGSLLDLELAELLHSIRCQYHRIVHDGYCTKVGDNLGIRQIVSVQTVNYSEDGDWFVTVEYELIDSGLPLSPTLDEFRLLMLHWQAKYGGLVGHANSDEATEYYATYIGRNGDKYSDRLDMPDTCMGNPYSSLSGRTVRFDTTRGVEYVNVNSKLTACYAYYLKTVRDLVAAGNEDDEHCPRHHWVRFHNVFDHHLACHCGNFTNRRAESRFCHGLVIHGIAEIVSGEGSSHQTIVE